MMKGIDNLNIEGKTPINVIEKYFTLDKIE